MEKYKCIPCDREFEVKPGVKPRCPSCMGVHDIELIESGSHDVGDKKKSWLVPVAVVVLAGIVGLVYLFVGNKEDSSKGTEKGKVTSSLYEELGLSESEIRKPVAVTERISKFASKARGGAEGVDAMQAIFNSLMELKKQNRWKPHHQREPRRDSLLSADELLGRLTKEGSAEPVEAMSYELACLLYAAARSQDLAVDMVEILSYENEKSPADPAGKVGRFGVILNTEKEATNQPLFDLYGGRSQGSAVGKYLVLNERQIAANHFGIQALQMLAKFNMAEALKLNEKATELDPDNPYFRAGRGLIFVGTGVPSEAIAEFEKAVKLRGDAVQRIKLAEVILAASQLGGSLGRAESEIHAALELMPDYAQAHALLATIHMMKRDFESAETELFLAKRLDPDSPTVAMLWAQFEAARMHTDEAIAKAQEAVRLSGESVEFLIGLAAIYKSTARFDEMRATLDKLFEKNDNPVITEQIKKMFGYDPSEDEDESTMTARDSETEQDNGIGNLKLKLGDGLGKSLNKGAGGSGLGGNDLNLDLDLK